jgi:hypothetical protein
VRIQNPINILPEAAPLLMEEARELPRGVC